MCQRHLRCDWETPRERTWRSGDACVGVAEEATIFLARADDGKIAN